VTIASSDASVENTEKVRVGLWVGLADPAATTSISVTTANVAADPIRPYAYTAVSGDIRVYNIHTGSLVTTVTGVAGAVGFMTVSHDGSTLYAVDTSNSTIVRVNLDTQATGTSFSGSMLNPVKVIDYTRINGVEVIISGSGGQIFNAQTGALFPTTFGGNIVVAASRGGSRFCTVDTGVSAYSISCPSLDFTSLNGGQLLLGNTISSSGVGGNGEDIAVNAAGTLAYVAAGGPPNNDFSVYSTETHANTASLPGDLHSNNVEVAADGRIFGAGSNLLDGSADVWVYAANGTLLTTRKVAAGAGTTQIVPRQMRISGDGLRLLTVVGTYPQNANPVLIFTTVAP